MSFVRTLVHSIHDPAKVNAKTVNERRRQAQAWLRPATKERHT
jgi:hypothetical protein